MNLFDRLVMPHLGKSYFRSRLTRRYKADLQAFLRSDQKIKFKSARTPDVSVIVPVFNSAHHTLRCLQSLLDDGSVSLEIIIFDNASTDETADLLQHFENVVVVKSAENIGFVSAVNAASKLARGRFLLLLNNDATILSGHIRDAVEVFDSEPNVGAVGARIRLATGHVQEAGSIIFRDGTTDGYMRNRKTEHWSAMYMRDVDFCSGVFLLVQRRQFAELGGLDMAFAPAYYEETDLCMRLRAQGLRIIYNPSILIEHFEFGSQPSAAAFEAISKRLPVFLERWQPTLHAEGFSKRSGSHEAASRRLIPRPRLLLILDPSAINEVPGSIGRTLQLALKEKWHVSLFISGLRHVSWVQFHSLFGKKIELILNSGNGDLFKLIKERKNCFDLVAASGIQSSCWLDKLHQSNPACLADVAITSEPGVIELEQVLRKQPIERTISN